MWGILQFKLDDILVVKSSIFEVKIVLDTDADIWHLDLMHKSALCMRHLRWTESSVIEIYRFYSPNYQDEDTWCVVVIMDGQCDIG